MAKKKKKNNVKKSDKFIIFMTIAFVLLLVVWIIKDNYHPKDKGGTPVTEINYLDGFVKVNLTEILEQITKDDLSFIYLGYEGCDACNAFAPILAGVTEEKNIKVFYIDTKNIDRSSKEWTKFTDKLTKKVELSIKDGEKTTTEKKTIGKFLYDNGYTPTFLVFKKGKFIDGNIGGMSSEDLKAFLESAGY